MAASAELVRPNPALKRCANGKATLARPAPRGKFSPAQVWRPAVVARLASALGVAIRRQRCLAAARSPHVRAAV